MRTDHLWPDADEVERQKRRLVEAWRLVYTKLDLWELTCPRTACHRARACTGEPDPQFPCVSDGDVRISVNRVVRPVLEEAMAIHEARRREAEGAAALPEVPPGRVSSPTLAQRAGRGPRGGRRDTR
jgi:hypothetical protein